MDIFVRVTRWSSHLNEIFSFERFFDILIGVVLANNHSNKKINGNKICFKIICFENCTAFGNIRYIYNLRTLQYETKYHPLNSEIASKFLLKVKNLISRFFPLCKRICTSNVTRRIVPD